MLGGGEAGAAEGNEVADPVMGGEEALSVPG